jgi:hypothetical protein
MKNILYNILVLLVVLASLGSCKKEDPVKMIIPQTTLIFDQDIDKIAGSFRANAPVAVRVNVSGAPVQSIRVSSRYNIGGNPVTHNLGTVNVAEGVANFSVPANQLRRPQDPVLTGAGSAAANTVQLLFDAVLPDGNFERRIFSATVTAP